MEGFRRSGYRTIGSGAVDWFDSSTETGAVLATPFEHFFFAGKTWSLEAQFCWINDRLAETPKEQLRFVFLNVGETHVPYWHQGAHWDRFPSPFVPFGGDTCCAEESRRHQKCRLEWVDGQLGTLLERFADGTVLICSDHGDCWGEDGLWEYGVSHKATLTLPFVLSRGKPIASSSKSRRRSFLRRLFR